MILKILKYFALAIAAILVVSGLLIGGFWLKYRSVADKLPKSVPESIANAFPLTAKVNPFIGTGGIPWTCAYNFPGASVPLGTVRLSPETISLLGYKALNTSGYFYGDEEIIGFSHTRLVGTGATDGGHFLVMPLTEDRPEKIDPYDLSLKYSHEDEIAYPGYYAVEFPRKGIKAELTATKRVGLHRYSFPHEKKAILVLNVTNALDDRRSTEGFVDIDAEKGEITGHVRTFGTFGSRIGGLKIYFAAKVSHPLEQYGIWKNGHFSMGESTATGDSLQALLIFSPSGEPVELKLAVSHVSIENARENLGAEASGKNFEEVVKEALEDWEKRLSLVQVTGGTDDRITNFYTALYRCYQMPTLFEDVNGEYVGFDKKVHKADSFIYYTDMSIWDTFRSTHPLYTLLTPDDQRDMILSLTMMARQGGWFPRWPSGYGYTNSMLGSATDIVISEAYQKGIRGFDINFAYEVMKKMALASTPKGAPASGREGCDDCLKYKYCPADLMKEAVSRTIEFSWSDHAISLLATELGYEEDAELFRNHSKYYKNTWNPETRYFHPRNADGTFVEGFDPLLLTYLGGDDSFTNDYVEGSALQWRYAPFFDAEGLVELVGGKEIFAKELNDGFFAKTDPTIGKWNPGPYYWHGNEPDFHAAYLFNAAGRPDLTQKWVRWIIDNKYKNTYYGLDGNDDAGTLSAWYVFSALGFYPVAGTTVYQLGAPLFEKAVVNMFDTTLTIIAENYAPDHMYVKNIWLNDKPLDRSWINHDEIKNGGVLRFEMSREP